MAAREPKIAFATRPEKQTPALAGVLLAFPAVPRIFGTNQGI